MESFQALKFIPHLQKLRHFHSKWIYIYEAGYLFIKQSYELTF